jgi:hypothetical protein
MRNPSPSVSGVLAGTGQWKALWLSLSRSNLGWKSLSQERENHLSHLEVTCLRELHIKFESMAFCVVLAKNISCHFTQKLLRSESTALISATCSALGVTQNFAFLCWFWLWRRAAQQSFVWQWVSCNPVASIRQPPDTCGHWALAMWLTVIENWIFFSNCFKFKQLLVFCSHPGELHSSTVKGWGHFRKLYICPHLDVTPTCDYRFTYSSPFWRKKRLKLKEEGR